MHLPLILIPTAHFFIDMVISTMPIALPILKLKFALSFTQVGLVATALNLTASAIQPAFGTISDRWQTNWLVPFGLFWTTLAMGLIGFVPNYYSLLLLVLLAGLGSSAFHPRGLKAAGESVPKRKGLAIALFMLGGNLGFAVGPVVAALIFLNLGLRWAPLLLFPVAILAIGLWRYKESYNSPAIQPNGAATGERGQVILLVISALCLLVILRSWAHQGLSIFLPLFLQSRGYGLDAASHILFAFLVSTAVGSLVAGYISDLVGRRKVMAAGLLLFSLPMLLSYNSTGASSLLWLILAGFMLGVPLSTTLALAQELMPTRTGLASGLMLGLSFGLGGIGVSFSGLISDLYGLHINMVALALLPLFATPFLLLIKEPKGGEEDDG